MAREKSCRQVAAEVAGRAREKNRHALGGLSGARRGACSNRLRPPVQLARGAGFERPALHQRIAPAAQRGDMYVKPVVPPINRFGIECEEPLFFRTKGRRKQSCILAFENMLVVKDERLLKFLQFFPPL